MTYCANCGAPVEGRFCPKCGAPAAAGPPPASGPATPPPGAGYTPPPGAPGYSSQPGYAPQPGYAAPSAAGLQENVASALCYLAGLITGILFLVLAPYNRNPRIRFHAFQAIFFHVAWIIFWIALSIIATAMPWGLHLIVSLFHLVIWLGGFIVWLLLMWKAYNNDRLVLPVVGPMAEQQANRGIPVA